MPIYNTLLFYIFIFQLMGISNIQAAEPVLHNKNIQNTCPSNNFKSFIKIFSEKTDIQEHFTKFPLRKLETVDSYPEPKIVTKLMGKEQVVFPIMKNKKERQASALELDIDFNKKQPDQPIVRIFKPDTDYVLDYYFKKQECWMLFKIEDLSL